MGKLEEWNNKDKLGNVRQNKENDALWFFESVLAVLPKSKIRVLGEVYVSKFDNSVVVVLFKNVKVLICSGHKLSYFI